MPKVSVIIPVYNKIKYIDKCINSVMRQTFRDIEIILVDDGSVDGSGRILKSYAKEDSRIRIIKKPNGGQSSARNKGIEEATGDYISFVDADDYIDEKMIETMYSKVVEHGVNLVVCDYKKINVGIDEQYITDSGLTGGYYDHERFVKEYYPRLIMRPEMEFPLTVSNCILLIRRQIIIENNIRYDEKVRISEDELFGCLCAYHAGNMFYLKDHYFYNYVNVSASVSKSRSRNEWFEDFKKIINDSREFFESVDDYDFKPQLSMEVLYFTFRAIVSAKYVEKSVFAKSKIIKRILNTEEFGYYLENYQKPINMSPYMKLYLFCVKHKMSLALALLK